MDVRGIGGPDDGGMKWAGIALAVLAMISGLVAAWHWRQSAKVPVDPGWGFPGGGHAIEPVDQDASNTGWIVALIAAGNAAADLNRKAATWTAVSVAMGALASFVSVFAN